MRITIEALVKARLSSVWESWTTPGDITHWNFASEEWHCPAAEIDLREGGSFKYHMEAIDKSAAFDFTGSFTKVIPQSTLSFKLDDSRAVEVTFDQLDDGVRVTEIFETEDIHSVEQQKSGWQSILNNFKKHVEGKCTLRTNTTTLQRGNKKKGSHL